MAVTELWTTESETIPSWQALKLLVIDNILQKAVL